MIDKRTLPLEQETITEVIKQLEGGRPTKKETDITGLWHPQNFMRIRSGEIIDPNQIVGGEIFLEDFKLGENKLATNIRNCKGKEKRTITIKDNKIKVEYSTSFPNIIICNGYKIRLSLDRITEISWEKDDIYYSISIDSAYYDHSNVICEKEISYKKSHEYVRISAQAGDLEARIEVNPCTDERKFYVGKAKMEERDEEEIARMGWVGDASDEFMLVLYKLVDGGDIAWKNINSYLRVRLDRAGWTNSDAIYREWYVDKFMKENNKSNPKYVFR